MQSSVTEDREKYLGGSDIPSIMGISPFKTRFDMLRFKAGLEDDTFDGNDFTDYGNIMEDKIRKYVNETYKFQFEETKTIIENDVIDYRYHADGVDKLKSTLLEVKTTSQMHNHLSDYKIYLVQMLFGMELTDCPDGVLAVYERPEDLSEDFDEKRLQVFDFKIEDHKDLLDEIHSQIDDFKIDLAYLKKNFLATEEELPSRKVLAEIKDKQVTIGDMDIPVGFLLLHADDFTTAIKDIKEQLCNSMGEHGIKKASFDLGFTATYVPEGKDTETQKLDETRLKKEQPDIYSKYLINKVRKGKKAYVLIRH